MAVMRTSEVRPDVQYSVLEFFLGFRKIYTTLVGKRKIVNVISTVRK